MKANFFTVQAAGLTLAILTAASPLATGQTFNPTSPALGFNVFTTGGFTVTGGDTHGPVAVGGNMTLAGSAPLAMNSSGTYPTNSPNNTANYGLVINGRIIYSSGGNPTYVNKGLIRIGSTAGTVLFDKDNNNANTDLQLTYGTFNSTPRVQKQNGWQAKATATEPHGINFTNAASQIAQNSVLINSYATNNCQGKINYITLPACASCNPNVPLQANKVNFINIPSEAALNNLLSMGSVNLGGSVSPSANSPLIINVQASGAINWAVPNLAGIGGSHGAFILWNFPNATSISFSNNNSVYGTILAPKANITKNGGNNFEGQVLSSSLTLSTGEIHFVPFAVNLPLCTTPLDLQSLTLSARRQGSAVKLQLNAQGLEDASLTIERSVNGLDWQPLALEVHNGAAIDANAPNGRLHYRLTAISKDGSKRYSNSVQVSGHSDVSRGIGPNPFTGSITVQPADNDVQHVQLIDASGRLLAQKSANGPVVFDGLETLPAGLYMIRVQSASGQVNVQKVVKQ